MQTFHDTLERAAQKGYYLHKIGPPNSYIKFIEFGSESCKADFFNEYGSKIGSRMIRTDERHNFILVPDSQLPDILREREGKLARI